MKRCISLLCVAVSLLLAYDVQAICQTCLRNGYPDAMCWTVSECEPALYGACWVQQNFDENGQVESAQCVGGPAGSECNQSCGGGGGGGVFDQGGNGEGECESGPLGCPAYCASCT